MGAPLVAILGTRYPDFAIEEEVLAPLGVTLVGDGGSPEEILAVAGAADVVLAGSRPKFDRRRCWPGSRCRGIVRYGIGIDSIDLDAARQRGIAVARVSDYGTEAVAFHAVATAMRAAPPAARGRPRRCAAGGWGVAGLRPLHLPSASTAGVVGYGRIGRQAAALPARASASRSARTTSTSTSRPTTASGGVASDELLETSDVVTPARTGRPVGPAAARRRPSWPG